MMNLEVRSLVEPPEFRSAGGKLVAAGVAMRYGAKSKPIAGQFREVFNPGRSPRRSRNRTSTATTNTLARTWPAPAPAPYG
jgi:hypothetical protein